MTTPWGTQLQSLVIVTAPAGAYAGIFIYSPAPGFGTLIGSWAAQAGIDPFGNPYPQGINVTIGTISGITFTGTNFILNSQGLFFYSGTPALGNLITSITEAAGTDSFGNVYAAGMTGQQLTITNATAPAAVAGTSILYSSSGGRLRYINGAGVDMILERSAVNVANFSMNTQTLPTILGAPMFYQPDEGSQNSEYEIEVDGIAVAPTSGTGTGPQFNMGMGVDGSVLGASFTVGGVFFPPAAGVTVNFTARLRMVITSTGVSGNVQMAAEGSFNRAATAAGNGTNFNSTVGSNSGGTTKTFDTTSSHTLQPYANWSAVTQSGHNAVVYRTRITRRN